MKERADPQPHVEPDLGRPLRSSLGLSPFFESAASFSTSSSVWVFANESHWSSVATSATFAIARTLDHESSFFANARRS